MKATIRARITPIGMTEAACQVIYFGKNQTLITWTIFQVKRANNQFQIKIGQRKDLDKAE